MLSQALLCPTPQGQRCFAPAYVDGCNDLSRCWPHSKAFANKGAKQLEVRSWEGAEEKGVPHK